MAVKQHYQVAYSRNGRCSHLKTMFIEDLIMRLACDDKFIFEPAIIQGTGWESTFTQSVATQITNGNALTEKQASLMLRILKKYQSSLEVYFQRSLDLENPIFKTPFRRITEEKSVSIEDHNGKRSIMVRFAYDAALIKQFQEYVSSTDWKSILYGQVLKHEAGSWDHEVKAWVFTLKEENIIWLASTLMDNGFVVDAEFRRLYDEIVVVLDQMYENAPCVIKQDGRYVYKNVSLKAKSADTINVQEFLFQAKNAGVTAWNEDVDRDLKHTKPNAITKMLLNTTKPLFVDSTVHAVDEFESLVKYGGPLLIIIPGGSEQEHLLKWHHALRQWGITDSNMSVMFRVPNNNGGVVNLYIKDNNLNNEIHEDTKVVFVSTKLPKPLIKSGIRFNTVLNLGYYRDLHFSMSVVLNSTTNVCYYNNKQPLGVNTCPQRN